MMHWLGGQPNPPPPPPIKASVFDDLGVLQIAALNLSLKSKLGKKLMHLMLLSRADVNRMVHFKA